MKTEIKIDRLQKKIVDLQYDLETLQKAKRFEKHLDELEGGGGGTGPYVNEKGETDFIEHEVKRGAVL